MRQKNSIAFIDIKPVPRAIEVPYAACKDESHPPQRPACISSALLLNYSSGIPPRAIRTSTGRRSNKPSLRATPPCATSFLAGRQPDQPTFYRVFLCTSAPPSRRFRSLLAKAGYTPPTTASFCSARPSTGSAIPVRLATPGGTRGLSVEP